MGEHFEEGELPSPWEGSGGRGHGASREALSPPPSEAKVIQGQGLRVAPEASKALNPVGWLVPGEPQTPGPQGHSRGHSVMPASVGRPWIRSHGEPIP